MKKFIFIFAALFLGLSQVSAQEIYVDNFTAPEGGVQKFDVKYRGIGNRTIQGYIFKFEFPEGLSLVTEETEEEEEEGGAIFEFGEDNPNTKFDVKTTATGVQASPSSKTSKLSGSEGTLLTLTLKVNAPLAQGDVAKVKVYDASLTEKVENTDGTSSYKDLDTKPFEFTVTIVEDRVIFNETDTKLPAYTAGKGNVRVNRVLKAGKWNTICLPFGMTQAQVNDKFGEGHVLVAFDNWEVEFPDETALAPSGITVNFKKVTAGRTYLVGGTPYLIKSEKDVESFDLDGVTLVAAPKAVSKSINIDGKDFNGVFEGTFTKTVVPADGLFINSEKFYYSTGKTNIKAFRGWFMLDGVLNADMDFSAKIGFTIDGDATDIDGIPSFQRIVEGVYDLSGRKIQLENGDLNKLQKGVYIIDGKKVTIK